MGLVVRVESAQRVDGQGIFIHGISIFEPQEDGEGAELVYIDEIVLVSDADLLQLVQGKANATETIIRRPIIRVTRQADGSWNIVKLMTLPKFGTGRPTPTKIEDATIEIIDPRKKPASKLILRNVNLVLTPESVQDSKPTEPGQSVSKFQGLFNGDHVGQVEFSGILDPHNRRWSLDGKVRGLNISGDLLKNLPGGITDKLSILSSLRGQASGSFHFASDSGGEQPFQFAVFVNLSRGTIEDPGLRFPLTDLQLSARFETQGFEIKSFTARSGASKIELSGKCLGYEKNSPYSFRAKCEQLDLESVGGMLPEDLKIVWNQYSPRGTANVNFGIEFDGRTWNPEIELECLDVGFKYYKFPYLLEHTTGTLWWKNRRMTIDLKAFSGTQPVLLRGEIIDPGPGAKGLMKIEAKGLPIDDKLLGALSPAGAKVVRSLNAQGTIDIIGDIWRDKRGEKPHHQFKISLNGCSTSFEKFPYPLRNITGILEVHDLDWKFYDLRSSYHNRYLTGWGSKLRPSKGGHFELHVTATDVPLEAELRDAFGQNMQNFWDKIHPRGTLDRVTIDIRLTPGHANLDLVVRAEKDIRGGLRRIGSRGLPGKSISIHPEFFPYRWEKLGGMITYTSSNRRVTFKSIRAVHKQTKITTDGYCALGPDGSWDFHLVDMSVDRLRADHDLTSALKGSLREGLIKLKPTGPISLRGNLRLSSSGQIGTPIRSQWKIQVNMLQGSLSAGDVKFENLNGGARLFGNSNGSQFECGGELGFDSLTFKNFQFTNIRGPMWVNGQYALFGSVAAQQLGRANARDITAKVYGGQVSGNCRVTLGNRSEFLLNAKVKDGNLRRFANERLTGKQDLEGKVFGHLTLQGSSQGVHTLSGRGKIEVRNGKMYDLPLFVSLLKILRVREPSRTAFNRCLLDFQIKGNYVDFKKMDFRGDAISLIGKGWMNFDTNLNMKFASILGHEDLNLSWVRKLISQVSEQIMVIYVSGTLDKPTIKAEPFPGVKEAFKQLEKELKTPPSRRAWTETSQDIFRSSPWPTN